MFYGIIKDIFSPGQATNYFFLENVILIFVLYCAVYSPILLVRRIGHSDKNAMDSDELHTVRMDLFQKTRGTRVFRSTCGTRARDQCFSFESSVNGFPYRSRSYAQWRHGHIF